MFEQAVLPVQDQKTFAEVHAALDRAFSPAQVAGFLRSVQRARLRARQFEAVLAAGLLGEESSTKYAALGDSDRGQVRERYLSMVERVDPAIRAKFLKVYAYY
ncbi:MAG TPA: hypothetical protein VE178_03210 [Silvibacterium sp.]|jgi:hypothetical protein|nr:hypothetical protein [Silvibacterium sp.]